MPAMPAPTTHTSASTSAVSPACTGISPVCIQTDVVCSSFAFMIHRLDAQKKADVAEPPEGSNHVGLLFNQPPGTAGVPFK